MESQAFPSSKNHSANPLPKIQVRRSWILGLLVLLLWIAPTVRWRIELGVFSFAFMEPVVLLVIMLLLLSRKSSIFQVNTAVLVLVVFFLWILVIRPWSQDWKHGLSDLRDWGIPLLAFGVILSTIKRGWRHWTLISVAVATFQACFGIFQVLTNSYRPFASVQSYYKVEYLYRTFPSFAVGFFEHPNSLAVFLIIAIMVAAGWLIEQETLKRKLLAAAPIVLLILALYWTYAKAEIATLAMMLFFFFAVQHIRSSRVFIGTSILSILLVIVAGWLAMNWWPVQFSSIWWRIDLWKDFIHTISGNPDILIRGNGETVFAANAIWAQPHNIIFDTVLNYGIIGLLILFLFVTLIIKYGTEAYDRGYFNRSPILRAIWVSILGFLITGIVESSLLSIETRMLFLLMIACFVGLGREIAQTDHGSRQGQVPLDVPPGAAP